MEEQKINEFKKVTYPRQHKVLNSLGIYDSYKWIRKNKWLNIGQSLTEHQFYTIIRSINKLLAQDLIQGKEIKFPYNMGKLELRKSLRRLDIVNGKLVTSLPVDWDRTLKLWAEEGKSNILIRQEDREVFKVLYPKRAANYTNKGFYQFKINRSIKVALKDKIKNKQIDAYIL